MEENKTQQQPPAPHSESHPPVSIQSPMGTGVWIGIVLLVFVVSGFGGYMVHEYLDNQRAVAPVSTALNRSLVPTASSTPQALDYSAIDGGLGEGEYSIAWLSDHIYEGQQLFTVKSADALPEDAFTFCDPDIVNTYYHVGDLTVVQSGEVYELVAVSVDSCGPGPFTIYRFAVASDGSARLLANHSQSVDHLVNRFDMHFAIDTKTELPEFDAPDNIRVPANGATLVRVGNAYFPESLDQAIPNRVLAFTHPELGEVYTSAPQSYQEQFVEAQAPSYSGLSVYYVQVADGSLHQYVVLPDFVDESTYAPRITWSNGEENHDEYTRHPVGGCGFVSGVSVMHTDAFAPGDLTQIGVVTKTQQAIYGFTDTHHPVLQHMYENEFPVIDPINKIPIDEYLEDRPVFFWEDTFGNWVVFRSRAYAPLAECGKPVIYLYPEQSTEVLVEVEPQGGFTITEPAYNDGWRVVAQPDGGLTDVNTGLHWPYLFWEGHGTTQGTGLDRGFVVAQEEVDMFLRKTLPQVGLNPQESKDFREFWVPYMSDSPYYFVTFYGNRLMDEIAPLTVTPEPDTVIRILMEYHELDQPIAVSPMRLSPPARRGFTVVEWGGVLHQ